MREYLKTRFGVRWWASRKAGETLIDLWNTGGGTRSKSLPSLIGLGALDFDWLASNCWSRWKGDPHAFDQSGFDVRCEWGENGVRHLAHGADAVIIVDVLRSQPAPDIDHRGAGVRSSPLCWKDESVAAFAASVNAELAGASARRRRILPFARVVNGHFHRDPIGAAFAERLGAEPDDRERLRH